VSVPLITICTPAYKADRYLEETLASIRAQTFGDWELIVVEDGSRDRTEEIVQRFAQTVTQPTRFIRHEKNSGLPATRNTAIAAARGEWIALVDADDLWTPNHLAQLVARTRETGADVVHSASVMFDSDSGREMEIRAPDAAAIAEFPLSLFRGRYLFQPSSTLVRREKLRAVGGFDASTRYVEDFELWMRMIRAGARFAFAPEATCRYRQHATAMTRNAGAMAMGLASVYSRNVDWEGAPRELRVALAADTWLSAGRILLRADPKLAAECFRKSVRHRPTSLVAWCYRGAALLWRGVTALKK
jgi:cellulose synthase/poly-beta-1,6-N-acetylglucosamine synthase-like glycosyltransferase